MGYGPFASPAALREWMEKSCLGADPLFHAVVARRRNKALGVASYLRIDPPIGVIGVGPPHFSPALHGTPMAPETKTLKMARALGADGSPPHGQVREKLGGGCGCRSVGVKVEEVS